MAKQCCYQYSYHECACSYNRDCKCHAEYSENELKRMEYNAKALFQSLKSIMDANPEWEDELPEWWAEAAAATDIETVK